MSDSLPPSMPAAKRENQGLFISALLLGILFCLPLVLVAGYANYQIGQSGRGRMYSIDRLGDIPTGQREGRTMVLMLGASVHGDGRLSGVMSERVSATAVVLEQLPVTAVVLSGDGGRSSYNEVDAARNALIDAGIDPGRIKVDPEGDRTLNSLIHFARQYNRPVYLISHRYHLERALYLADRLGIDSIGVAAGNGPGYSSFSDHCREIGARLKALIEAAAL